MGGSAKTTGSSASGASSSTSGRRTLHTFLASAASAASAAISAIARAARPGLAFPGWRGLKARRRVRGGDCAVKPALGVAPPWDHVPEAREAGKSSAQEPGGQDQTATQAVWPWGQASRRPGAAGLTSPRQCLLACEMGHKDYGRIKASVRISWILNLALPTQISCADCASMYLPDARLARDVLGAVRAKAGAQGSESSMDPRETFSFLLHK